MYNGRVKGWTDKLNKLALKRRRNGKLFEQVSGKQGEACMLCGSEKGKREELRGEEKRRRGKVRNGRRQGRRKKKANRHSRASERAPTQLLSPPGPPC